ncbi:hypothetical protein H7I76_01070 [Mycolicibacterium vaccae]|nr:hypothetical protein [Mycolicibacterium vaccae]
MSTELHYMSAVDLLKAFGEKSISPLEALEAVQVRAAEVEPGINALIERDWEDHTIRARASTERYAAGAPLGPLDGLPVVVKEEHPHGRPRAVVRAPWLSATLLQRRILCRSG